MELTNMVSSLDEFVGQKKLKARLRTAIDAAKARNEMLPHVLLCSGAGSGKSTLAFVIANELQCDIASFQAPIKPKVTENILTGFSGVCLLDEFHRFPKAEMEAWLSIIRDGYYQGPNGKPVEMAAPICFVATTDTPQRIIKPLMSRFRICQEGFEIYLDSELAQIARMMFSKVGVLLSDGDYDILGRAAAGVPRTVESFAQAGADLSVTGQTVTADAILEACQVSRDGLRAVHENYLRTIHECGGTVGLDILSTHLKLNKDMLMEIEELLIRRNFLSYGHGRSITPEGRKVLGLKMKFQ